MALHFFVHVSDVLGNFFHIWLLWVSWQWLVSNIVGWSYSVRSGSLGVLLGTVVGEVSRLFAVEAESFLQVLASFFIGHSVDGGGDNVDVHSVWVSVRSWFMCSFPPLLHFPCPPMPHVIRPPPPRVSFPPPCRVAPRCRRFPSCCCRILLGVAPHCCHCSSRRYRILLSVVEPVWLSWIPQAGVEPVWLLSNTRGVVEFVWPSSNPLTVVEAHRRNVSFAPLVLTSLVWLWCGLPDLAIIQYVGVGIWQVDVGDKDSERQE